VVGAVGAVVALVVVVAAAVVVVVVVVAEADDIRRVAVRRQRSAERKAMRSLPRYRAILLR
jgi:hypothetical protein